MGLLRNFGRRRLGIKPAAAKDPNLVPFAPYEIHKADLDSDAVAGIVKTLKSTGKLILKGGPLDNQKSLFA